MSEEAADAQKSCPQDDQKIFERSATEEALTLTFLHVESLALSKTFFRIMRRGTNANADLGYWRAADDPQGPMPLPQV